MGALNSIENRGDDYYQSFASIPIQTDQSYGQIGGKPKHPLPINQNTPRNNRLLSSNSIAQIFSQYPATRPGFPREVHGPVRNSKFRKVSFASNTEASASSRVSPAEIMGRFNLLRRILGLKKDKDSSIKTSRHARNQKGKEVIEVDNSSIIEDVEIVEFVGNNSQEFNARTVEGEVPHLDSSVITDVSSAKSMVDDGEESRLSPLKQFPDYYGVPPYLLLYDSVKEKEGNLANTEFDIELAENHLKGLHLSRLQKKEVLIKKDLTEESFRPLSKDEEKEVSRALSNRRKVLVTHVNSNIDITGETLQSLRPRAWLNDEVINLYLELLKERERREPEKFLKCHFFNTFFYKKLIRGRDGYNFESVQRWTTQKKLGYSLLECDKIFVPIHKNSHWCLAVINKKDEKFQYLDSLGIVDHRVLNVLSRYFVDEVKDKCGREIDLSSWVNEFVEDLPEQENGHDCGMFMIKYVDFYSRDLGLWFSQEDIPYFRRRTAKEILHLRAEG